MKTIKNRNVNGRPPKIPSEKKAYKVSLKLETREYYSLKAKVSAAGLNRSEFIRQCIHTADVRERLSPEQAGQIRQLCGMANNLNQLARTANAAGYLDVHRHCLLICTRLDLLIKWMEDDR